MDTEIESLTAQLFDVSDDIRYVAVHRHGRLTQRERADLRGASAAESDRYEELLVNPTLLALAGRRGDIDCGGLEFILIRYGNFFLLAHPIGGGHLSVGIEPTADPLALLDDIRTTASVHGLLAQAG